MGTQRAFDTQSNVLGLSWPKVERNSDRSHTFIQGGIRAAHDSGKNNPEHLNRNNEVSMCDSVAILQGSLLNTDLVNPAKAPEGPKGDEDCQGRVAPCMWRPAYSRQRR
jgi:hypothetical protein